MTQVLGQTHTTKEEKIPGPGGPVKLRLKPSSEERGYRFEAQLHWE